MRLLAAPALVAVLATSPAAAYMIYPDRDDPDEVVVRIEQAYGDLVPFRVLPRPFDRPTEAAQGPGRLTYRWTYPRSPRHGLAFLSVDEDGVGTMQFEFEGSQLSDGDTLAAAAVLVDGKGQALHTFLARALVTGEDRFEGGARHVLRLAVEQPPHWWRSVDGVAFLYMSYKADRELGDDGILNAMRRAVRHFAGDPMFGETGD
ncbi:MAG: hypothetical protein AB7I79_00195 [Rhizobiaceae bacterium]